ncbi:MAG: late competence development ComFB family protein [Spirochaetia bacterium]|jgi:competence protein ComFB|nr:late competence development ComFB family protein [Spirochaetales bacterium]
MVFEDQYNFESLVNETEELVVAEIGRQLPEYPDLCTCSECILDVAAYALNRVRPRYRVSLLDTVYVHSRERSAYLREIRRAVTDGILKVRTNPPHD